MSAADKQLVNPLELQPPVTNKTPELAKALVAFQAIVPVIPKNQTAKIPTKSGSSYSYSYADLGDIQKAIREPLKDNGLAVTQFLGDLDGSDCIYTKVWHVSGETEEKPFRIPTNGKTPQEVGSVVTYYKRYALGAALGISTEEDDDGKSGNRVPVKASPRTNNVAENAKFMNTTAGDVAETVKKMPNGKPPMAAPTEEQLQAIRTLATLAGRSPAFIDQQLLTIDTNERAEEAIAKLKGEGK